MSLRKYYDLFVFDVRMSPLPGYGNIAGFRPMLVMDVWKHAFLLDYKPAERGKYIDAFFANINWDAVEEQL